VELEDEMVMSDKDLRRPATRSAPVMAVLDSTRHFACAAVIAER
jgi:hypothetical protein